MRRYEDFVIAVQKVGDADIYAVNVIQPCGGQIGDARSSFLLEEVIQAAKLVGADSPPVEISKDGEVGNYGILLNAALSPPDAVTFGDELAKILFKGPILATWGKCSEHAKNDQAELSIRLDLSSAPELAALPWEYLRLPADGGNFVGLDVDTTIVRYLQTDSPVPALKVNPPIRVLVAASIPANLPALDVNQEIEKVKDAFSAMALPYVEITVLQNATRDSIDGKLKEGQENGRPFHVFHFIGHGVFDKKAGHGALLLEDAEGKWSAISDEDMGRLLQPYRSSLRLVVLNACEGSRLSVDDSYTSVAAKVIQLAEVPAAIAMQFRISDKAAVSFAGALYREIADGENVETAVDEARRAVNTAVSARSEWATPVFYLRAKDSCLIDMRIPRVPVQLKAHYDALKIALPARKLVFFLGLNVNSVGRPVYDQWEPKMAIPTTDELASYFGRILGIATTGTSLAGLSQRVRIKKKANLDEEFDTIFAAPELALLGTSKLYEVLSKLAKKITAAQGENKTGVKLPGLLFVTATYDASLEQGFKDKIERYHVISYEKNKKVFSHRICESNNFTEPIMLDFNNTTNSYTGSDDGSPIILKLPGEAGSSFAVTEDDFFAFLSTPITSLIPAHILGQIRGSRHLYLGYDLQNWTIRFLRSQICQNWDEKERDKSNAILFHDTDDPNAPFWDRTEVQSQIAMLDDYVEGLEKNVLLQL